MKQTCFAIARLGPAAVARTSPSTFSQQEPKLANSRQFRSLALGRSVGAATVALAVAIVFVLTVVASPAAQAQTFHVIHTFTGKTDGGWPRAGVTIDNSGNLYGTTYTYGAKGWGTIYRMKRTTSGGWTFNTLYTFTNGKDGAFPAGRVIVGPNGTLYGTTQGSGYGSSPYGTVFNLKPPATCTVSFCPWKITTLYAFKGQPDCNAQTNSFGDLVFDNAGNIYGTTYKGGADNEGCVYKIASVGNSYDYQLIKSFAGGGTDGRYPYPGVIVDKAGNLYGTTAQGGPNDSGTVYQLLPSGGGYTEHILYSFMGGADGSNPFGGLILRPCPPEVCDPPIEVLYGSTEDGGAGGAGTAFSLTPAGNGNWSYAPLYSFAGGSFCGPYGNLASDVAGNLYGDEYCGTTYGQIFMLSPLRPPPTPWRYTLLHDFTGGSDGAYPIGNVTFDASGHLYGTASQGANGTCQGGCGVVWETTP
jgi:uncharacterized repeat protein (TIGR03803 family)